LTDATARVEFESKFAGDYSPTNAHVGEWEGTMIARAWRPVVLTLGVSLLAGGLAYGGDKVKSIKDATIHRLDLKAMDRVKDDADEVCLRRRLKRRKAPDVYYAPPMTFESPAIDPHLPAPAAKPAEAPPAPPRVDPPTLPAPSVPMTFPYDGGPVKTMPRTRPADGPVLGPTPTERMVVEPTPPPGYTAYGEDRQEEKRGARLLLRRNRR
jgi:hypothetical protein